MLKVVLVVLFALFAIATAANSTFDFEGTYTWNGTTIYLCQDGSDLSGRIGSEAIFYANVKASDDTQALGKYFYLGDLYTGTRVSFRRFTGGRGRIGLAANSTNLAVYVLPRDATGASNGTLLFVADKTSTSISTNSSTRIFDCAIMDRTSSSNVAGHWKTTDNTQINAYICLTESAHGRTNGKMYGSYSFYFTSDGKEILPGYFTGYCAANAQLCGVVYTQLDTDYKSYSTFGAELIYRLSNGRLVIQHTRGAPGIIGFSFRIRANELVYVETAATSDCTQYESSYFNPTKCKKFTLKECKALAPFGFCQVADKQGSCVRNHTFF